MRQTVLRAGADRAGRGRRRARPASRAPCSTREMRCEPGCFSSSFQTTWLANGGAEMTMLSNRMRALIMLVAVAAVDRSVPTHAEDTEQMVTLNPQTLKFTEIPDMPACASAAILRGNPRNGPAWVLLKLASGCEVPWHWHSANETLLVIS